MYIVHIAMLTIIITRNYFSPHKTLRHNFNKKNLYNCHSITVLKIKKKINDITAIQISPKKLNIIGKTVHMLTTSDSETRPICAIKSGKFCRKEHCEQCL